MNNNTNSRREKLAARYASKQSGSVKRGPMGGHGPGRGAMASGKPKATKATVLRLLSYLKGDRMRIVGAFLFMLVSTLSSIAGTYVLRPVINYIAPQKGGTVNWNGFVQGLVFMGLVYIVGVSHSIAITPDDRCFPARTLHHPHRIVPQGAAAAGSVLRCTQSRRTDEPLYQRCGRHR